MSRITIFAGASIACLIVACAAPQPKSAHASADQHEGKSMSGTHKMPKPNAEAVWDWLQSAEYRNWAPWPGTSTGLYEGKSAVHGDKLTLFVNRKVFENLEDPPHGSVVIKENYSEGGKLGAITVMYRVKGYDSDAHDWWWAKLKPNGEVFADGKAAGKVRSCISCHSNAKGGDFVFTNDDEKHMHGG